MHWVCLTANGMEWNIVLGLSASLLAGRVTKVSLSYPMVRGTSLPLNTRTRGPYWYSQVTWLPLCWRQCNTSIGCNAGAYPWLKEKCTPNWNNPCFLGIQETRPDNRSRNTKVCFYSRHTSTNLTYSSNIIMCNSSVLGDMYSEYKCVFTFVALLCWPDQPCPYRNHTTRMERKNCQV